MTDRAVYVVEVNIKPRLWDIGGLLVKADVVTHHYPDKEGYTSARGALICRDAEE